MTQFSDTRINEALELLNAAARDNKAELKAVMEDRHADLSSVLSAFTNDMKERASEKFIAGKQRVVEVATNIDKSVHTSPWAYIGGVAAAAMLCGFLMGRSRKE